MKDVFMKAGLAILAVFAPAQDVMVAVFILLFADLIAGVWAAKKRKEPITSAGLHRTIVKIFVYEIAIALGFIAQRYLLADSISIINIIGSYIGITQLVSVYENINEIAGGDLLKGILSKLKSKNDV